MADYLVSFIMSELKSGIYKITINDYYIYIGQTNRLRYRINTHIKELTENKHYNKKFQNVFNKYPNTIKFEVVEYCDVDKLDEREMYWINYYRSFNTNHGLNMSIGGDSNRKFRTKEESEAAALEARKKYYNDNIEKLREYNKEYRKQWYQTHKTEHLKNVKTWQANNRERYLKNSHKPLDKKYEAIKNNEYCYSIYAITTPDGTYIGCHGHMKDDITLKHYWGSGVRIKEVIKRVGKENCKKEILYTTHDINEAKKMESLFIQMSLKINNNILNCDTKSNYYYRRFNCEKENN